MFPIGKIVFGKKRHKCGFIKFIQPTEEHVKIKKYLCG